MHLDKSLNFSYHIKEKMFKVMKGMVIIRKLNKAECSLTFSYNK